MICLVVILILKSP